LSHRATASEKPQVLRECKPSFVSGRLKNLCQCKTDGGEYDGPG